MKTEKKKLLVLGASGMVGHVMAIYFAENNYDVATFTLHPFKYSKKNIVGDANNSVLLKNTICQGNYDAIINCIGILNQDAETKKHQAVYLNSYLPHFLAHLTRELKTRVIQISTDCVFSGTTGGYNEKSPKGGETFYDRSKALGELENDKDLTFRNSIIGPDTNEKGMGLFNWFMKQDQEIEGFTRAMWTGVTNLTLARAIAGAIENNLTGTYHLVNNISISKHDLLVLFNKYFKENKLVIKENDTVKIDRSLVNNRKDFDFIIPSYEEMIKEMKEWVYNHKDIYPHYFNQ
jgi:dTDP-4-dehydrorhamnose reductase